MYCNKRYTILILLSLFCMYANATKTIVTSKNFTDPKKHVKISIANKSTDILANGHRTKTMIFEKNILVKQDLFTIEVLGDTGDSLAYTEMQLPGDCGQLRFNDGAFWASYLHSRVKTDNDEGYVDFTNIHISEDGNEKMMSFANTELAWALVMRDKGDGSIMDIPS